MTCLLCENNLKKHKKHVHIVRHIVSGLSGLFNFFKSDCSRPET